MPEREPGQSDELERERQEREAAELKSFERRAEWSALHHGVPPDQADERRKKALRQAERMGEPDGASRDD